MATMTAPEPWPSEQNQCTVCAAEWDGPEDTAGCPVCCYWEKHRDPKCECEWCEVPAADLCCKSCDGEGSYEEWNGPHVRTLPCPDCQDDPESPVHPAVAMQVLARGGEI